MTRSPRRLKQQVRDTVGEQVRDLPLHAVRLAMFGVGRALLLGDRVTRDYKEIKEGDGVKPVLGRLRDDVQHTAEKVVGRVVEHVRGEEPEPEAEPARRTGPRSAADRSAGEEIAIGKPGAGTRPAPRHTRPGPPPKPPGRGAAPGKHRAEPTGRAGRAGPFAEPAPKPTPAAPRPEPEPQAEPAPSPKAADTPKVEPKVPDEAKAPGETKAPGEKGKDTTDRDTTGKDEAGKDEAAFEPKPESKPAAQAEAEHIAEELPVPDYDSATLPQLRARLRGLTVDQVKLLREYERKHAGREDVIRMYERRIAKLNGLS